MPRKHDLELTDAELAAWLAAHLSWKPTLAEYQDWIREIGWRSAAVQAADLEFTERRKRGAA